MMRAQNKRRKGERGDGRRFLLDFTSFKKSVNIGNE